MPLGSSIIETITAEFLNASVVLFEEPPTDEYEGAESDWPGYMSQSANLGIDPETPEVASNTLPVVFTNVGSASIAAIGLKNASGDLLHYETLASPVTTAEGDTLTFAAGAITVTVGSSA